MRTWRRARSDRNPYCTMIRCRRIVHICHTRLPNSGRWRWRWRWWHRHNTSQRRGGQAAHHHSIASKASAVVPSTYAALVHHSGAVGDAFAVQTRSSISTAHTAFIGETRAIGDSHAVRTCRVVSSTHSAGVVHYMDLKQTNVTPTVGQLMLSEKISGGPPTCSFLGIRLWHTIASAARPAIPTTHSTRIKNLVGARLLVTAA